MAQEVSLVGRLQKKGTSNREHIPVQLFDREKRFHEIFLYHYLPYLNKISVPLKSARFLHDSKHSSAQGVLKENGHFFHDNDFL